MTDWAEFANVRLEAFNARDWDAVSRGLPEDFELVDRLAPENAVSYGPNALRDASVERGIAVFPDLRYEAVEAVPVVEGSTVRLVLRIRATGTGVSSGAVVSGEIGHCWTIEDGIPRKIEQLLTWEEARATAGLEAR